MHFLNKYYKDHSIYSQSIKFECNWNALNHTILKLNVPKGEFDSDAIEKAF